VIFNKRKYQVYLWSNTYARIHTKRWKYSLQAQKYVTKKGSSIWLPRLAAQKLSRRRWVRIVVLDDHVELWPDASFLIDGELQV